ncbi:hypothetical protein [Vibrio sp. YIC-376]|uniref:hypothetical protein n=1 Tax=Vibrio sp. YIC-376 TaxID=3136162 RepID=UPI00402AA487
MKGLSPIAGSVDVLFTLILFLQLAIYFVVNRDINIVVSNKLYLIFSLLIFMTASVLLSKYNNDFIFLILYLKDFFVPLTAFFYFYICIRNKMINPNDAIRFLYYGLLIVSSMSLIHYLFNISDVFERYVPRRGFSGDEFASIRVVMGIPIPRMNSLFVLSTQGASSCLYAVGMYLSIFEYKHLNINKAIAYVFGIIFTLCGVFSVSFSFILTLSIIFLIRVMSSRSVYLRLSSLIFGGVVLFLLSSATINDGNRSVGLIPYALDSFIGPAVGVIDAMSFGDFIFGFGIIPKLYYNEYMPIDTKHFLSDVVYDNWLIGAFLQAGFIYSILSLLLLIFVVHRHLNLKNNHVITLACTIFLSFLGFSHGFFLLDRLFIFKAALVLAIIFNENSSLGEKLWRS